MKKVLMIVLAGGVLSSPVFLDDGAQAEPIFTKVISSGDGHPVPWKNKKFDGFYGGLHSGSLKVTAPNNSVSSAVYGGSVGYRYQTDNGWLAGLGLQFDKSENTSFVTAGLTLGYLPHPDLLVFGTFASLNMVEDPVIDDVVFTSGCCSYTLQAGIEYAVTSRFHLRAEYKFANGLDISEVKNKALNFGVVFQF